MWQRQSVLEFQLIKGCWLKFDYLIEARRYSNRSEAIRDLIHNALAVTVPKLSATSFTMPLLKRNGEEVTMRPWAQCLWFMIIIHVIYRINSQSISTRIIKR
jgi:hypothetical protein